MRVIQQNLGGKRVYCTSTHTNERAYLAYDVVTDLLRFFIYENKFTHNEFRGLTTATTNPDSIYFFEVNIRNTREDVKYVQNQQ